MASDLTIYLDDEPGELARLGEVLGKAGINIDGFCALTSGGGRGEIHVLVDDVETARRAIEEAGLRVGDEREALVVHAENLPGELGRIARRIADQGVNILCHYVGSNNRLVFVVDDAERARNAIGG
jgi:hypothetical protein